MIIKEQDLLNYISCPIKYSVNKNGYDISKKTYNSYLHEMFDFAFSSYLYENESNLDNKLKKKWDNICLEHQDIINPKQVIEGWGKIYKIYEYIKYNKPKILDLDIPYEINIGNNTLIGQISLLIDRGNQIEVLIPSFSNKMPDSFIIDSNIKNTIDSYVVKNLYKKETVFTYYNFTYNKYKYGLRSDKDYKKLKLIVNNVATAIKENIIFPHSGYHCTTCLIKSICSSWGTDRLNFTRDITRS